MVDFIASSFWKAFLFTVIVNLFGGIIGGVLKKKIPILAVIFQFVPNTFAYYYVWQIRQGIGWLIFSIICVIGLIASVISIIIVRKKGSTNISNAVTIDSDEELKDFAEQSNSHFPKMVNDTIRIDSVSTKPGKIIVFHATLLNLNIGDERIPSIKLNTYKNMVTHMKTSTDEETVLYRNSRISCCYIYNDANGNYLFDVLITPKDYL